MKKKLLSIILTVMLVLSVCPVVPVALAAGNEVTVIYRYFDEAGNLRDGLGAFYDVDYVNSDTDEFNGGTYVVSGKVTVDDSIEVTESANLVLLDGCELTVTEGIEVEGSHTLAIYAQSTGENKGKLFTTGCNDSAGIGSNVGLIPIDNSCGYIDIYGGYIEATGGYKAAGIGGGTGLSGGTVVVYDGEIVAKGGLCGAGIGGGCDANGGKLTVYGGKITATGGSGEDDSRGSAGIGGGEHGNGGEVIIYDGKITAQGECGAAGIGGGCNGDGGTVSIYGGYVNALTRVLYIDGEAVLSDERYLLGAGIGGGCYGNGGNVMLYGGEVVASIKDDGYDDCYLRAIGGGDDSDSNGSVNYASGMLVYDCRANKYLNDDFTHTDLTNYFTGRDDVVHFRLTRTKGKVSYKEYDPDTWSFTTKTCEDYTIVKKNITSWKDGWYVADTTGTINGTVTVTGDVHLILESGTILTVEGGVRVEEGSSLTIYSQVEDIPQGDRFVISASANCAGIGGGNGKNSGNITVHGANLVVNGGENAAAIGGGNGGNGGIFTVYSGRVTANAGSGASRAIGAGVGGSHNGEIYLRDGYNAHSYIVSPGIPEREPGQKWVNLITGSNVDFRLNPISKNHIKDPESYKYYDEDLKLNDGSCTEYLPIFDDTRSLATGWYVVNGELTVDNKLSVYGDVKLILKDGCKFTTDGILVASGGTLTVYGQSNGTGELVAEGDSNGITVEGTLNIHGGTVTATGVKYECAGINTTEGTLNIFGGTVTATGGTRAAGIGGSDYDAGGNITINGGKVTATGGSLGAGIGGGCEGSCGNITINGGEVTAVCGSSAAAIGCGNEGSGGDVTVTGGTVNADGSTGIGIGSNSSSIRKINLFINGGYITAKSKSGNDVIIANKVRLSPEKCESFKVLLDNSEAEGSPYTALAEIYNVFAGHGFAHIESNFSHNVSEGYCTVCGAQVFDTYIARSWDAGEKKVVSTETNIPEYIQKITEDTTELHDGLYVVDGEVTVEEKITVSGDAGLILKDGCILTLKNGLEISSKGTLTVYGQAGGTGELITPKLSENVPAIGVGTGAELTVHGGKIYAYGGNYAAGIGGGYRGDSGDVTVYGGSITAYGGANGAGIGGGDSGAGGTFTIYGGKVDAHGSYSSGIGGGQSGAGGTIIINGGEVGSGGNIGSGYQYGPASGSTVVINGGTVSVTGDNSNVGGNGSTVEINGGEVKIAQGTLGVGYNGSNCNITIRGGTINSFCYYYPAVGGTANNVKINIYGGSIKAESHSSDAIVATSVKVYPDAEKCERFTVKDLSGNELSGSPVTEEKDITSILSENKQVQIEPGVVHTFTGDYVNNGDGTHSRKCSVCGVLSDAVNHTFVNHICVCGAKNEHNYAGEYKDNGDGTHSRKCTECNEYGTPEEHKDANVDNICDKCGAVINKTIPTFTGLSLTLGSDISINFYMELTEEAINNGTMTFNIGGRIVSGVKAKYNETEKKYYFQTPLTALEMNETVIVTFNYNGVDYIQEYSVAEYIEAIINSKDKDGKDYSDEMKALAKKIANYGHYAQTYLASIHKNVTIVEPGDDSDKGYDRMIHFDGDFDIKTENAKTALENYKVTVTGELDNLSLYGSTVYFDSATALNYYVTAKNGEKPTAAAVNTATGKSKEVEIKLYKKNIYIVSVKDITATELADNIEVTVNGEITFSGSVFAYCNSVVKAHNIDGANEKDTFAVNAMAAFYEYYLAAVEYAKSTNK